MRSLFLLLFLQILVPETWTTLPEQDEQFAKNRTEVAMSKWSTHQNHSSLSLHHVRKRVKRQFGFGGFGGGFGGFGGGFGGCCPFGGIGPINSMCCSATIGIMAPCCMPPLLPLLPPPMPILPPPILPIGGGCCPCCMPMCVPICVRATCGGALMGGGLFGGFGGGCPFGGWRKKMMARKLAVKRAKKLT